MDKLISFLLITLTLRDSSAFNLEARLPIVKKGHAGAYFGFSVAEHQEDMGFESTPRFRSWMLIGAPLDQNNQPGTNRSGALWKCPMTTNMSDCIQVITDGRITEGDQVESSIENDDLIPPFDNEIKTNQWLGVTVRSGGSGGKVMVCAHRHVLKSSAESFLGQGQCYILTNDFKYQELKKPCSGKITDRVHEQYGLCQAGVSGVLTSGEYAVIGTPGPITWKGTIYVISVSDDFINKDTVIYNSPFDGNLTLPKYSYLGMSAAVGNFFGTGQVYAAGAPRANGTGSVMIFSRQYLNSVMKTELAIYGDQFASSFGYEIASADINGDQISDLIVGAPFYFGKGEGGAIYVYTKLCEKCSPVKLVGKDESRFGFAIANLRDLNKDGYEDIAVGAPYEGKGTVYIYLGSKKGLITTPSQIIHSEDTPVPLKTFGYSLSGGLDMDMNEYPDLLVGAYENDAVALLRARKIIDIVTFVRFHNKSGYSQEKMEPIDPNKVGCLMDPNSNYTCFSFEACCKTSSIRRERRLQTQTLKLKAYIEAETYSGVKKFSRVRFGNDTSKPHFVEWVAILDTDRTFHCHRETVYLKEGTRDIQNPIKFRLNYTLQQDEPVMPHEGAPLPDINNYPILNQQEAARIFEASFQKDCGNNDICESDLRLTARLNLTKLPIPPNYYELLLGDSPEVIVDVDIVNVGESAYEAQLFVTHSSNLSYIGTKNNESASCSLYNTTLMSCSIGNPFKKDKGINLQVRFDPKGLEDSEDNLVFMVFVNSTSKEVTEKKPIKLTAKVLKKAELSIKGSTKPQWELTYGGPIIGESMMKKLSDIGPKVQHIYEIFNEGPWKVSSLDVHISWPYEVANDKVHGKWLLYLEDIPTVRVHNVDYECRVPEKQVNPLKLQHSSGSEDVDTVFTSSTPRSFETTNKFRNNNNSNLIRNRRHVEKVVASKVTVDDEGKQHEEVSMNCRLGTAKCFIITCTILNLQKKEEATITVKARLWNSTLVEDYPKVDRVRIGSNAKLYIPPNVILEQDNLKDDYAMAETTANPGLSDQQEAEPVPFWIIVVAVVAGLLLLVLLTLILWKLGFFKRRRPDHTLSGNLQKHHDDNPENEALVKHTANNSHNSHH